MTRFPPARELRINQRYLNKLLTLYLCVSVVKLLSALGSLH